MEDIEKEVIFSKGKTTQTYKLIIHNPNKKEDFDNFYNHWFSEVLQAVSENK